MPRNKPCLGSHGQRCPNLTRDPSGRGVTSQPSHDRERNRRQDAARPSPTQRGYGSQHRALREKWANLVANGDLHLRRTH
jgi:hypothetical protein